MIAKADFPDSVKVEGHLGIVCSVVLKFIRKGNVEDSELYSVGCLALMEAARTFDSSKSRFCTWATRIVTQRVIDEIKRGKRIRETSSCDMSVLPDGREECAPVQILDNIIASSSREPQDESTKMLLGHYLEGKSLAELGREFGFSKEWVRKRIQSAASRIRSESRHILENHV